MHDLYVQARRNICFTKPDENDRRTDLIYLKILEQSSCISKANTSGILSSNNSMRTPSGLDRKCMERHDTILYLRCFLFNTMVRPVPSCGFQDLGHHGLPMPLWTVSNDVSSGHNPVTSLSCCVSTVSSSLGSAAQADRVEQAVDTAPV